MPSLRAASVGDSERLRRASLTGRPQGWSYRLRRTRHRCRPGDNRWGKRSVSRLHPATYDRTNNVKTLPYRSAFSLMKLLFLTTKGPADLQRTVLRIMLF